MMLSCEQNGRTNLEIRILLVVQKRQEVQAVREDLTSQVCLGFQGIQAAL